MGGNLAIDIADELPGQVAGLILVESIGELGEIDRLIITVIRNLQIVLHHGHRLSLHSNC